MPNPKLRRLNGECADFNAAFPVGTAIKVWPGAVNDKPPVDVKIVDPGAYVLGDHTAVVQVSGGHGCIALTHVLKTDPEAREQDPRQAVMTDTEIAIRASINVLRDTIESRRMPSGLPLTADAAALHLQAAAHLQLMLRRERRDVPPDDYLLWSHKNGGWWAPLGWGYTSKLSEAGRHRRVEALTKATAAIPGTSSQLTALPVLPIRLVDIEAMVAAYRHEHPGDTEPWE